MCCSARNRSPSALPKGGLAAAVLKTVRFSFSNRRSSSYCLFGLQQVAGANRQVFELVDKDDKILSRKLGEQLIVGGFTGGLDSQVIAPAFARERDQHFAIVLRIGLLGNETATH